MSFKSLVLDAGPLLAQSYAELKDKAEKFYTTPSVISEIKDERARQNLQMWEGNLIVRTPSSKSLQAVSDFAKKTGDYAVLSTTDLHILALCYEIDVEEHNGDASHLRKLPKKVITATKTKQVGISFEDYLKKEEDGNLGGEGETNEKVVNGENHEASQSEQQEAEANEDGDDWDVVTKPKRKGRGKWGALNKKLPEVQTAEPQVNEQPATKPLEDQLSSLSLQTSQECSQAPEQHQQSIETTEENANTPTDQNPSNDDDDEELSSDYDSDDDTWITPSNIKETIAAEFGKEEDGSSGSGENSVLPCAISTVDFACQNVALQMGLNLSSVHGRRVTNVRNFMLRCHACFTLVQIPTNGKPKHFCPTCGSNTLLRCSVSVNKDGELVAHLKKNFQWSNRGNKYTLPSPFSKNSSKKKNPHVNNGAILLREDERAYEKAIASSMRKKRQNDKTLDEWSGSGSADNIINPFAFTGYNRDISRNTDVRVGQGRYVNSVGRKKC